MYDAYDSDASFIYKTENCGTSDEMYGIKQTLSLLFNHSPLLLTPQILGTWHKELLSWEKRSGEVRTTEVYNMMASKRTYYLPPHLVESNLLTWCDRVNEDVTSPAMVFSSTRDKFIRCVKFYTNLLEIHPFHDGNGRIGWMFVRWFFGRLPKKAIQNGDLSRELHNAHKTQSYNSLVQYFGEVFDIGL